MGWEVEHRQGLDALLVERPLEQAGGPGRRLSSAANLGLGLTGVLDSRKEDW